MQSLELLAPAKNLECGIAAIDHGADAVYIGAPHFGARAAACNSVDDIAELCRYAHQFDAKVYVTVNTIVYDDELSAVDALLHQLADARVDAVLVQDMGLLSMRNEQWEMRNDHSSLVFHASTQTDNRTPEKVAWLRSLGFKRVVLARELSIDEIAEIHRQVPDVELEVFVHGALCVSYSGVCYASQYCFGRSANRGECAQFCRMKFDLLDADGRMLEHDRHLLSLKDMCQIDNLEALIEAGAVSFKIEGRLKDVGYVKNVVAAYSQRLNQIIRQHPDRYCRASKGSCTYSFAPSLAKTFNRGYTTYFARGRQPDIASFDTPKAMGEFVGTVKEIRGTSFNVAGTARFANGDGLCFVNEERELEGFRVNRVEGNRIFPLKVPARLRPGMRLYRNNDQEFERLLSKPSATRKIQISMQLAATPDGFQLSSSGVTVSIALEHQTAEKPQQENIIRQLTKLGGTPYECSHVEMAPDFNYFIPSSKLAELRRMLYPPQPPRRRGGAGASGIRMALPSFGGGGGGFPLPFGEDGRGLNISNARARAFYEQQGLTDAAPAFELSQPKGEALIMQCRHCLRYALGYCVKHGGRKPDWHEPLHLRLGDGREFRLEFDCKHCQMNVYAGGALNDK